MPNITRVDARARSLQVNWTKPELGGGAIDIVSYFVFWTPGSTNNKRFQNVSSNSFSYRISNLQTNARYSLSVVALGSDGRNGTINYKSTTTSKLC